MISNLVKNYKNLLFTIFHTDNDDTKSFICVYDTKDNDRLIAIFNNSDKCSKFFNTTRKSIDTAICKHQLRCRRYRLERVRE